MELTAVEQASAAGFEQGFRTCLALTESHPDWTEEQKLAWLESVRSGVLLATE